MGGTGGGMKRRVVGGRGGGGGGGGGGRPPPHTQVDVLPQGTIVALTGLATASQHNDSQARVEEYDVDKCRYVVTLAVGGTLAVRPHNVRQVLTEARIIGTSKQELNGRVASSAVYESATKRYRCEGLKPDGTVLSVKAENVVLPVESRVTIEGVQSRPELNGKVGRIDAVESERYVVNVGKEVVRLRFGAVAAC